MNAPRSIAAFRATIRDWTWDDLKNALGDFDRYSDAELAALREECERRNAAPERAEKRPRVIRCLRCDVELTYTGTKRFHEGTRWGALGELGELFVNKEKFDVYFCPRCGKVEFFVDGVGEELRPE